MSEDIDVVDLLAKSIVKWQKVAIGEGVDLGSSNCALCEEFANNDECEGCPIVEKSKLQGCEFDEYQNWARSSKLIANSDICRTTGSEESIDDALVMLEYLQILKVEYNQ